MGGSEVTAYRIAERFVGMGEVPGRESNPAILAMLRLDAQWPEGDEVPWCSAFANYIAWLLRLPRSKSLRARSWLQVGQPVTLDQARCGFDVVILNRAGATPDPNVIDAPGHVGFYAGRESGSAGDDYVLILGGNQSDRVSVARYDAARILGLRRLA